MTEKINEWLVKSLGEPDNSIEDHSYEIRPLTVEGKREWWMFHNGVGSGEPLAQWLEAYAAQQSKMFQRSIADGKVLMYGNIIVDSIMLPDGIYGTKLPRLYPSDETIEHMIEVGKMFRDKTGTEWLPDSYFDNLTKCELRDVVIVFQEQQSKIPTEEEMKKRQKDKGDYLREMGYPPQVITKYQDAIKETWEWLRNQIG